MSFSSNAALSAADIGAIADVTSNRGANGCFGGLGGDNAWWVIILLLFLGGGNWGGNRNNDNMLPYVMSANNSNNDVQRGFDQAAITSGIGNLSNAVSSGFASVNQGMCSGNAAITAAINNGFAGAEAASSARQMANMQQLFGMQSNFDSLLNNLAMGLQNCCCENRAAVADVKYAIATENCADRAALSEGLQNLIMNNNQQYNNLITTINNGFQAVYNQSCMDKIDAKNEKIADLQRQLTEAKYASEVNAMGNRILANNDLQTAALEQYLRPVAQPAYIVQNPNCCNQQYYGTCGCAS